MFLQTFAADHHDDDDDDAAADGGGGDDDVAAVAAAADDDDFLALPGFIRRRSSTMASPGVSVGKRLDVPRA